MSSPRRRGCSHCQAVPICNSSVFPAQAGVFPFTSIKREPFDCLPRAGGGVPGIGWKCGHARPSSPRRRGCSLHLFHASPSVPVFPAQAGVFLPLLHPCKHNNGLPRAGGGVPWMKHTREAGRSSSPRRRGCSLFYNAELMYFIVFPAQAGVFPLTSYRWGMASCLPRAGGGVPFSLS